MLAVIRLGFLLWVVDAHNYSSEASCMMTLDAVRSNLQRVVTWSGATVLRLHIKACRAAGAGQFLV